MAENRILIVDFGGQYNQLIARRAKKSCLNGIESVRINAASEIIEEE